MMVFAVMAVSPLSIESLFLDHCEHFVLSQDQVLFVVDLDLGTGILADEDAIPLLDVQRELLALLVDLALADGDDLRLHRLLLGGVGDDEPPLLSFLGLESLDENAVVEWTNFHNLPPESVVLGVRRTPGIRVVPHRDTSTPRTRALAVREETRESINPLLSVDYKKSGEPQFSQPAGHVGK